MPGIGIGIGIGISPVFGKSVTPTIKLSSKTIEDGSASGTVVGTLSAPKLASPTFSVSGGADQLAFTINVSNELVINEAVDFATQSSYEVEITASEGSETFVKMFTIIVSGVLIDFSQFEEEYATDLQTTNPNTATGNIVVGFSASELQTELQNTL